MNAIGTVVRLLEKCYLAPYFKAGMNMLKPGDRMPDFEVVDQDGNTVRSADLIGRKTIISRIFGREQELVDKEATKKACDKVLSSLGISLDACVPR